MVILDNKKIRLEIAERGAEIRRCTVNGEERFYDGNPEFWTGVAPVLFPVCSGLKDNKFTVGDKSYTLEKHGFAKKMDFIVEEKTNAYAVFLLKSTPETLKSYPWEFEFRIKYTLNDESINVKYDIKNLSDSIMYAGVGSHEAYSCPEGIEDYDLIFEKKETLKTHRLSGSLITRETDTVLFESDTLPLYYKYFSIDALIFSDVKSRFVTLRNRKNGKSVSVAFPDCPYLVLWTKPDAPYFCIEPWINCPTFEDESYDITAKVGMAAIKPQEVYTNAHTIYF